MVGSHRVSENSMHWLKFNRFFEYSFIDLPHWNYWHFERNCMSRWKGIKIEWLSFWNGEFIFTKASSSSRVILSYRSASLTLYRIHIQMTIINAEFCTKKKISPFIECDHSLIEIAGRVILRLSLLPRNRNQFLKGSRYLTHNGVSSTKSESSLYWGHRRLLYSMERTLNTITQMHSWLWILTFFVHHGSSLVKCSHFEVKR